MRSLATRLGLRIRRSETTGPVLMAVTVGLAAGLGAVTLRFLIALAQRFFFGGGAAVMDAMGFSGNLGRIHLLFVPALGMIVVAWMVRRFAPEAGGHGVPEVQYAVLKKGGRIRPRVAVVKAVASAISIGSGGSVGREGPIVQIGSAMGSAVGRVVGTGQDLTRILVAAGAAGAIGGTFNAPVAGVMFAVEVVLTSFAARSLGLVVIAAVTATAFTQAFLGSAPAFQLIEPFTLVSEAEFGLYLVLGVFVGVLSTLYIRTVYGFERLFSEWEAKTWFKALVGGLAVGAMGFFGSEHLFGIGHEGVELALRGDLLLSTMLLLVVLKMLATSITLGAGGSGGVFAPALFVGAMAGGAFGKVVHGLFPTWTAPEGAYALVGMAALFGGAAHAPVTAMVALFEMTDNYEIVLPLMFSVVMSYLIASRLFPDSIYSLKLRLRGALGSTAEASLLDVVLVTDAMSLDCDPVSPDLDLDQLEALARHRRTRSWPVVDANERLVGIVTDTDLLSRDESDERQRTVADIMTTAVVSCRPDDSLGTASQRFGESDFQLIPVVEGGGEPTLVGVLRRSQMRWAARTLSEEHRRLLDERDEHLGSLPPRMEQVDFVVPAASSAVTYRHIRQLDLPPDTLVVMVRRGERAFVPSGHSVLEPGDELLLVTAPGRRDELRSRLARWSLPD
jgi:CIC family chloride channel protein